MQLNDKISSIDINIINSIVKANLKLKKSWNWIYDVNGHEWLKYDENKGILSDFSWKHFENIEDYIESDYWRTAKIVWIIEYIFDLSKKEAIKWLEDNNIIEKEEKILNKEKNGFAKKFYGSKNNDFSKLKEYLENRAISFEKIKDEVGFYDNLDNLLLIWRNLDNEAINLHKRNIKAKAFYKENNWENNYFFLKDFDKNKETIAVEWDIDYLSLLQFKNEFENYNIVGVPGIHQFKYLFESIKEKMIYVIWDNDETEKTLISQINGQKNIFLINTFLKIKNVKDINDFLAINWVNLINSIKNEISLFELDKIKENKVEKVEKEDRYVFIKDICRYYWLRRGVFHTEKEAMQILKCNTETIRFKRPTEIQEYEATVWRDWWAENCFNLFDKRLIVKPNNTPVIHPYIQLLIENVCNYEEINIKWLYQAILYKYYNLNDYDIPAVVLYWHGGSWKWTLIKLLSRIFSDEYTLWDLGIGDLMGNHTTYTGEKFIVEYSEIITNNVKNDKEILNKLKNIIWAEKFTVNKKNIQSYQRENLAWFFISSNSNKPIQLDNIDVGNRRFSFIKSRRALSVDEITKIYEAINNPNYISSFIAWLEANYWEEIKKPGYKIRALQNKEKEDVEMRSMSDIDIFWHEIKQKYQKWEKITIEKLDSELENYCNESWESYFEIKKYMWNNSPFVKKKISIEWKKYYWIIIE